MGKGQSSRTIYIIDYGLAKLYCDPTTGNHIPIKTGKPLIGTIRYSSINSHLGFEQSRRDDLESLGYSLIFMAKGNLPWQGEACIQKQERFRNIMVKKQKTSVEILCKGLPIEFFKFMHYCKNLQFEDKPDYVHLKRQFSECFAMHFTKKPFLLDWESLGIELKNYSKKRKNSADSNITELDQKEEKIRQELPKIEEKKAVPTRKRYSRILDLEKLHVVKPKTRKSTVNVPDLSQEAAPKDLITNNKGDTLEKKAYDFVENSKSNLQPQEEKKSEPPPGKVEEKKPLALDEIVELKANEEDAKEEEEESPPEYKKQISEFSLCNFKPNEIIEDSSLLGICLVIKK